MQNDGSHTAADGATTGCAAYPGAFFCDDFEEDTTSVLGWTEVGPGNSSYAPCTPEQTSTAYSGVMVLRCAANVDAGMPLAGVYEQLQMLPQHSALRVALSVRVRAPGSRVYFEIDSSGPGPSNVELYTDPQGALYVHQVSGAMSVGTDFSIGMLTPDVWHRVDVILSFAAMTLRAALDAPASGASPVAYSPGPANATYQHALLLTSGAYTATSDADVEIDDVVAWLQ